MNLLKNHPNCKFHNWLIYRRLFAAFQSFERSYKGRLVDLGCGEMPYRDYFLQFADEYVGVDWSNTLHNLKADVVADLNEELPLESESCDTVISISVMEHLLQPRVFMREASRILKKGGTFILQVPWQWHIHEAPYDFFRYTPYALAELGKEAGFSKVQIEPMGGFIDLLAYKFNYFILRYRRGPRFLRRSLMLVFWPVTQLTQILALLFSFLDREPKRESPGYFCRFMKE